jgi:hypothetical protein
MDRSTSTNQLGVSRPRRRATSRKSQWSRSDETATSDVSETSRGYSSGFRRRNNTSSQSLFGLGASSTNPNDPQPPLPSLGVIASELVIICSLYGKYALHSLRKPFRKVKRVLFYTGFSFAGVVLLLAAWLAIDFYMDAVQVCSPPSDYEYTDRPLVEYYVHGRGIGHYARSVAIVDRLNKAGVDVRMFLTRAAVWRALHEDSKSFEHNNNERGEHMGTTTAISVASLSPKQSIFETLSHVVERIVGDCEVSVSRNRYPHLVISDGEFPGMLRAEFGGIPSVGIAHGQLFTIAQKPAWIKSLPHLNRAWNSQGRLNGVSSFFSEWQIATHFCFLESIVKSGVVARAPMRPEVLQMAVARKQAKDGHIFSTMPQFERVKSLLVDGETPPVSDTNRSNATKTSVSPRDKRRKLVICYFRDHNGEIVVKALLNAGFDVLLFDNGYYKDMVNDPNRYGVKWVVHDREEQRRIQLLDAADTNNASATDHRNLRERQPQAHDQKFDEEDTQRWLQDFRSTNVGDGPRLISVMDRSLFVPLMHVADGVASSAGSQLMSECIFSHMPLLAMYLERDDEQKLNVELTRHPGPCHKSQVFGTSFESLAVGLKGTNITHASSPTLQDMKRFVQEVQSSRVSETFYQSYHELGSSRNATSPEQQEPMQQEPKQQEVPAADSEDPFESLPDAAEIILEIIKQVVKSR